MRRTSIIIGTLVLSCLAGCSQRSAPEAVVDPDSTRVIKSGTMVGFVGDYGSHVWLGVPYAKPPVGELRWRAPLPPVSWPGTREMLQHGSPCVQYASAFGGVTSAKPGTPVGSEDCLFLNVYAPRMTPAAAVSGKRVPVMVWIHGGGNTIGEGGFYDGGNLAATHEVIVITLNYRLGAFGWFRHAALRESSTSDAERSGNFGTLDLIRALEWVRDNVAELGGDPTNVTIFGESAGGQNVFQMLLSPLAKGLFHRAIVQSGGTSFDTVATGENFIDDAEPGAPNSSNEILLRLLIADGKAADRAAARKTLGAMSAIQIRDYLRVRNGYELLDHYPQFLNTGMIQVPKVFRDGTVLPEGEPSQLLAQPGGYNQVPLILGTNRDENKVFMFGDPNRVRKILWLIPRARDQRWYDLSAEYLAKSWKATGVDEPAAAMRSVQGPSVFAYRFDWDEEPTVLGADLARLLGAAHGFEIPFVFGHFNLGAEANQIFTEENRAGRELLSSQMMSYWAEFAYNGSPGRGRGGNLEPWLAWNPEDRGASKYIVFDTPPPTGGGIHMSAESVSQADLLASVENDPRLLSALDKCRIYRELVEWGRGIQRAEYDARPLCAAFPYDQYPW